MLWHLPTAAGVTALDHPGAGRAATRRVTSPCARVPVHQSDVCAEEEAVAASVRGTAVCCSKGR